MNQSTEKGKSPGGSHYEFRRDQLPVHCPVPGQSQWDSHPKVYIPLAEKGRATCPYCGAEFVLKED